MEPLSDRLLIKPIEEEPVSDLWQCISATAVQLCMCPMCVATGSDRSCMQPLAVMQQTGP